MATIKSFTDLEQSKKLAEILPLESADGHWFDGYLGVNYSQEAKDLYYTTNYEYLPAWSLAALLNVLPNYIDYDTIRHPSLIRDIDNNYMVIYSALKYSGNYDNPVDACVAMIEKLHELNLL